jgi:hypothetical protein
MAMNKSVVKLASGVAALSMWAGAPFAAYATGSWSTAVDVSASGFLTSDPEIAIDADGVMIAVWSHVGVSTKTIQVSTSSDGQGWTSPVDISPISHEAIQPHLVVDRTGQATVIWTNTSGTDSIWASKREWGETTWSTPVRLSVEAEETGQAQIVVDSNGAFTTIFNNWDAHKIQVRTSDDGVTWDAIVTLAEERNSQYLRNPQIAVDGAGRVTGIWEAYDAGGDAKMIASRSSTSRGVWTDATTLIGGDASLARIASTESGLTTVAAFSDFSEVEIQSRSSQDGGTWTTAVGHGTGDGAAPNVSVGASDTVVVTFIDDMVGGIRASSSQDGVQWTTNHLLDDGNSSHGPSQDHVAKVIADSSGQLTAVWMRDYTGDPDYSYFRATASTSADGVTWTEPVELAGTSSYSVNLVVNSECRVTALFELSDGTENTVQSRTLDPGGCAAGGVTSAPRSLQAIRTSATSRKLRWKAPARLNGGTITDYIIQYRVGGTSVWSTFTDGISTSRKVKVTGLTKRVKYQFQVAARTTGGDSPYSVATRAR